MIIYDNNYLLEHKKIKDDLKHIIIQIASELEYKNITISKNIIVFELFLIK